MYFKGFAFRLDFGYERKELRFLSWATGMIWKTLGRTGFKGKIMNTLGLLGLRYL